jgi:hypothetical protein
MKIAVFGDSFADRTNVYSKCAHDNESWMYFLQEKLNCQVDTFGYGGTSIWWSYKRFLQQYESGYDVVIFIYSSIGRIHQLPEHLNHYSFIKTFESAQGEVQLPINEKKEFLNFVELYFKYYHDDEFDKFVYQSAFDNINKLCFNNNIKLINFFPFELNFDEQESNIDFENRHGSCFTSALNISSGELDMLADYNSRNIFFQNGDGRLCHLTKENNEILAEKFINEILNPTNSIYKLDNNDFIFSKDIMKRYAPELV